MKALWFPWWLVLAACAAHQAAPVGCGSKLRPINAVTTNSAPRASAQAKAKDDAP
jgi:hypothetical protein